MYMQVHYVVVLLNNIRTSGFLMKSPYCKKKKTFLPKPELALKSIPHPGIFGGFGRNVFFLQYGDFIKKPEVLILLSKTTT